MNKITNFLKNLFKKTEDTQALNPAKLAQEFAAGADALAEGMAASNTAEASSKKYDLDTEFDAIILNSETEFLGVKPTDIVQGAFECAGKVALNPIPNSVEFVSIVAENTVKEAGITHCWGLF